MLGAFHPERDAQDMAFVQTLATQMTAANNMQVQQISVPRIVILASLNEKAPR